MEYRLYLLDAKHHIVATHGFIANDDISARETGSIVFDACEDVLAGYEVWRGAQIIATDLDRRLTRRPAFAEMRKDHQDMVCQYEEIMCDSFDVVRRSEQLSALLAARGRDGS
jgi:hypothetical protein